MCHGPDRSGRERGLAGLATQYCGWAGFGPMPHLFHTVAPGVQSSWDEPSMQHLFTAMETRMQAQFENLPTAGMHEGISAIKGALESLQAEFEKMAQEVARLGIINVFPNSEHELQYA